ncbi:MAG: type III-A CRISPR-associated protein Csm2, partial [bacterium]
MADKRKNKPTFPEILNEVQSIQSFSLFSVDKIIEFAQKMAPVLKSKGLKTAQIRKFFDTLRRIQAGIRERGLFDKEEVILLKPKLAYAAGRNREQVTPLFEILEPAISKINNEQDFSRFVQFVE